MSEPDDTPTRQAVNYTPAEIELERERMRLAACMSAALGNTPDAVAQRIGPEHPYWSASYGDMCKAVDREIELRAEVSRLREALDRYTLDGAEILSWLNAPIDQPFTSGWVLDAVRQSIDRARASALKQARDEACDELKRAARIALTDAAEVSRLQQENALLRRSLEMLTKQLDEKDSEIVELKDAVYRLCPPRS